MRFEVFTLREIGVDQRHPALPMIADLDVEAGNKTVAELQSAGNVSFLATNVGNEASAAACVDETVRRHGRCSRRRTLRPTRFPRSRGQIVGDGDAAPWID
jgi:hypothetical protein